MNSRIIRLMRFGLVGLLNTGIDLAVFTLLIWVSTPVIPAQVLSYSCGVLNSYILNSRWTFREERNQNRKDELLRFVLVNLAALTISTFVLNTLSASTGMNLALCKLAATAVSILVNYAGSRYLVFGQQQTRDQHGQE
ncbi:GtrA family protein [Paenibacillus sp. YPG26]|uniref:GtrA family protein n=1 Tax=Paenibacillus sp. YPG26 TaxID=2878915 RepID=UPI00203C6291|nr:GtrA family protein [Paenibacillus sp. YPG26]USB32345.1 GtrA family protein [Paenibacillus sp. YPG26]